MINPSTLMHVFTLSFLMSALCSLLISKIGSRISLNDNPNDRSSHKIPTPRGGGVGIWIAFLIMGVFTDKNVLFVLATGIVGLLGLLDDRFNFPSKLRLFVQCILALFAIVVFIELPPSLMKYIIFLFWMLFITGTANFYNFMDGINGIAGLTGVVGFSLIAYFSYFVARNTDMAFLSLVLVAGCLGFLPFNFPQAKVFMGDVGSVFLGFVFASFVMKLSFTLNAFLCLVMFLCMFYADAVVTIYFRWRNGENLMESHRRHLYQYMCNELAIPHWKVSSLYAIVQLIFGLLSLMAYKKSLIWQMIVIGIFGILFIIVYNVIKKPNPKIYNLNKA